MQLAGRGDASSAGWHRSDGASTALSLMSVGSTPVDIASTLAASGGPDTPESVLACLELALRFASQGASLSTPAVERLRARAAALQAVVPTKWREHEAGAALLDEFLRSASAATQSVSRRDGRGGPAEGYEDVWAALRFLEALVRQDEVAAEVKACVRSEPLLAGLSQRSERSLIDVAIRHGGLDVGRLVRNWRRATAWVKENAETLLLDEYVSYLGGRDLVGEVVKVLPPDQTRIGELVEQVDAEFALATVEVENALRPPKAGNPPGWWWYRVPHFPSDGFLAALEKRMARFPVS